VKLLKGRFPRRNGSWKELRANRHASRSYAGVSKMATSRTESCGRSILSRARRRARGDVPCWVRVVVRLLLASLAGAKAPTTPRLGAALRGACDDVRGQDHSRNGPRRHQGCSGCHVGDRRACTRPSHLGGATQRERGRAGWTPPPLVVHAARASTRRLGSRRRPLRGCGIGPGALPFPRLTRRIAMPNIRVGR